MQGFNVLMEQMQSDVATIAEQYGDINKKLEKLDVLMEDMDIIKTDVQFIKSHLQIKVNLEDFSIREQRVGQLEKFVHSSRA